MEKLSKFIEKIGNIPLTRDQYFFLSLVIFACPAITAGIIALTNK